MEQGAVDAAAAQAPADPASVAPAASPRRRSRLGVDLALLSLVGVLLVVAVLAAGAALYRQFYSPTAFVEHYLELLSEGHAADALAVPGVSVDSAELESVGLPLTSSDALLRRAALAPLADVEVVSERTDGDITHVEATYLAAGHHGTTTFDVQRTGWIGIVPTWRFAHSPLAVLDLTVRGSMQFAVNGFEVDKRQVSADKADADPLDAVPLLVFSPGAYRVSVDTPIAATPGVDVLADKPLANVPVDLQAQPTDEFVAVVQKRVDEFLAACATQEVLQPTGCPFGYYVSDRIDGLPSWSIATDPVVAVEPDGADWRITPTTAVARIEVDVVSLFDGSVDHVREDVPFVITGGITVLPDGTASIRIAGSP